MVDGMAGMDEAQAHHHSHGLPDRGGCRRGLGNLGVVDIRESKIQCYCCRDSHVLEGYVELYCTWQTLSLYTYRDLSSQLILFILKGNYLPSTSVLIAQ